MNKLPITIRASVTQENRVTDAARQVEDMWVGFGYPSRKKSIRPRRFLRVRDEVGICRYFYWTEPDKGKGCIVISHFKKRVKISVDKVRKHYNNK